MAETGTVGPFTGARSPLRPGPNNALTDVPGLRVGHASYVGGGALTGLTVVLSPPGGMVAAVDVRGGGPGTRETDALDPRNLVPRVEAVLLTGGSAYGLDAAGGVMTWLEERGRGFPVGEGPHDVVPVVPTAAVFDLGRGGDFRRRPDAPLARAACDAAEASGDGAFVEQGGVGAGTGALAGGLKGGVGTASVVLPGGVTVAALAVVNSAAPPVDPASGLPYGAWLGLPGEFPLHAPAAGEHETAWERIAELGAARPLNTVVGVVATDAELSRAQAQRVAAVAHDGLARAVRPVHTLYDGDTVFAVSTAARALPRVSGRTPYGVHEEAAALTAVHTAAADVFARAVVHGLLAARDTQTAAGLAPSYRSLYPTACSAVGDYGQ